MAQPLACRSEANGVKWPWNCVAELRTRVVSAPRPSIAVALDDRAAVRARDFNSSPLRGGRKAQHQKYQPRMRTWSKGDLSGRGWLVFSQQGLSSLMFDYSRPRAGPADDFADVAAFLASLDGVDGVDVGQGRGFNDVGRGGAAAEAAVVAFDLELQRHLALRVLALGHAANDELVQVGVHAGDPLDGLEDGVDRTVADRRVLHDLAVGAADRHGGGGQDAGAGRRVQAHELPGGGDVFHVLLDQDRQVLVVDLFLLVGQRLEIVEEHLELLVGQSVAQLGHAVAQRVPAGVLAKHEIGSRYSHVLGPHDLVGRSLLEHAVLVNSRLVGEGVAADDRLVPLHEQAGDRRDHPADRVQTLGLDTRGQPEVVVTRLQRHDDLLERGVAGALADAVDRALHLPRPGLDPGQAVGHRHAQVVVAVRADDRPVDVTDAFLQRANHGGILGGRGIADSVRDVDGGRTRLDGRRDDFAEEIELGPGSVFGGKLDVR